jgi:hypothetical protein
MGHFAYRFLQSTDLEAPATLRRKSQRLPRSSQVFAARPSLIMSGTGTSASDFSLRYEADESLTTLVDPLDGEEVGPAMLP